jgi:hypothetical protein
VSVKKERKKELVPWQAPFRGEGERKERLYFNSFLFCALCDLS